VPSRASDGGIRFHVRPLAAVDNTGLVSTPICRPRCSRSRPSVQEPNGEPKSLSLHQKTFLKLLRSLGTFPTRTTQSCPAMLLLLCNWPLSDNIRVWPSLSSPFVLMSCATTSCVPNLRVRSVNPFATLQSRIIGTKKINHEAIPPYATNVESYLD